MAKKEKKDMVEVDQPEIELKKPRKKHSVLKAFLIAIIIILVLPIALVYILFFDAGTKEVKIIEDFNTEKVAEIKKSLVKAFDKCKDDEKVSLALDETFFDNTLYSVLTGFIPEQFQNFVNSYVEIDDKQKTFDFYIGADLTVFKTRLVLKTKLSEQDGTYIFQISDIAIGRIHSLQAILVNFLSDDMLSGIFDSVGLSIKSDLKNSRLTYSKDELISDAFKLAGFGESSSDDLFTIMLNEFVNYGNINFSIEEEAIKLNILLKQLANNDDVIELTSYQGITNDQIDEIKTYFSTQEAYSKSDEELSTYFQNKIKEKVPTSTADEKLEKVIKDNADFTMPTIGSTTSDGNAYISAKNLNDFFKTCSSVVGFSFLLSAKDKTANKQLTASIVVNNLYCTIVDDCINFIISINFNGYNTYVVLNCPVNEDNSTNGCLVLDINKINFGQYQVGDKLKNFFIDKLKAALPAPSSPDDACVMKVEEIAGAPKLVLDFEQTVKQIIESKGGTIGSNPGQLSYEFKNTTGIIGGSDPSDILNSLINVDFKVTLNQ